MVVLFLDMDHFFAACEEARHPGLKEKALVVGTASDRERERGVVQTCNYRAREFGIHSAMPTAQALKLKPDLAYVESDDAYYAEMSGRVMGLLRAHGFRMETLSVDEAALDLGDIGYPEAEALARRIKDEISSGLGLPSTIGISTGKVYAKMVCDSSKPDGLGIVRDSEIRRFLKEKGVMALPGIGPKTADRLKAMGISTIGELANASAIMLGEEFGAWGREMSLLSRGTDSSKVDERSEILSIGRERTLDKDTTDIGTVSKMMKQLSHEVVEEVRKQGLWFSAVSVKVRYSDFTDRTKNRQLTNYSDSEESVYDTAMVLVKDLMAGRAVRKVGVRASDFGAKKGQKTL